MIHAIFRYAEKHRFPLALFTTLLAGALLAGFLHMRLGYENLFFTVSGYSMPTNAAEVLHFAASAGKKPLFLSSLLLFTIGSPFYPWICSLCMVFRGFALGWCFSMLPHTPGETGISFALLFVYLLESFLYIFLILRLQPKKHLISVFFPIVGLLLLLHIAVPLILLSP